MRMQAAEPHARTQAPEAAEVAAAAAAAAAAMASAAWRAAAAAAGAVLLWAAEGLAPGGPEDSSGSEEVESGCPHPPSVQVAPFPLLRAACSKEAAGQLEAGGAAASTAPPQVAPAQRGGAIPAASARSAAQAPHPRPSRSVGALLEPTLVPTSPADCGTRPAPAHLRHRRVRHEAPFNPPHSQP